MIRTAERCWLMDNSKMPKAQDTVAQLKNDIDTGRTGDKVASKDPGLSPLGTDDEAGGNPLSPKQIGLARRHESAIGTLATKDDEKPTGVKSILLMAAVVAVIVVIVVTYVLTNRGSGIG